jgi:hypothetical protein
MRFNFKSINKKAVSSLSLILLLSMTLMMTFVQTTSGQAGVPQPEKTAGYASVAPTLVGVGQEATVNLWVFPLPTTYNYGSYFNGFYGVTVTFVKPDGTKDTFMPTDGTGSYAPGQMQALGALFFFYKPSMAGNWSVSFTMPAQNITDASGTVQYSACTSNTAYFTVQTEPVLAGLLNGYPWAELPNQNTYWSYPINANNREWSQISGDFLGTGLIGPPVTSSTYLRWQPYGPGPNTGHIVWTNPLRIGGIIGGDYGSLNYLAGKNVVVIMDGRVYFNIPISPASLSTVNSGQFECIDEATGQVLFLANGSISAGIHIPGSTYYQSASSVALGQATVLLENSFGSYKSPYLYGTSGTNWNYYDPFTGSLLVQMANASTAQLVDNTVLAFGAGTITGQTGRFVYRWNMTSVVNNNWPTGITWKAPLPTTLTGAYPTLFAVSPDASVVVVGTKNQYWGYNAVTGVSLWNITIPYPITSNEEIPLANVDDFIIFDATAATIHCYSMKNGAQLWETPSFSNSPWATTWTVYSSETNDLNNLYLAFPDGAMRAYSLNDGHLVWTSTSAPFASTEYVNNVVPLSVSTGLVMIGGNLYSYAGYSIGYELDPVPRFAMLVCVNATTGDIVYTLNGGLCPAAAANGYVINSGVFDGKLYCVGKGPTSTTISAPDTSITSGTTVLIKGSILDTSPVSSSATLKAMFANGVPAISDADMSVWMDYLHMQNSTLLNNPPKCTGVPVTMTAVDPNGNTVNLGTTTSDGDGHFAYQWTPTTAGLYKIIATFAGSNSYFTSHGVTSATVAASSPAPTSNTGVQASVDYTMTIIGAAIAIIIVVAIVGLALFLALRKR